MTALYDLLGIIDVAMAGGIDLDHVRRYAPRDLRAVGAVTAGLR
jgi:hypothetical protein